MPFLERDGRTPDTSTPTPVDPVTYEDAKRCPKCSDVGLICSIHRSTGARGQRCNVETYQCMNDRCARKGDRWIVQINDDGTIPVRDESNQRKQYEPLDIFKLSAGARLLEQVQREEEGRDA